MALGDDTLTGLADRTAFGALLRRQVQFANDRRNVMALIVLDLDGFSRINATHGFDFGDQVLKHLALQLRGVARPHDYLARIGGDRFALLLPRVMNSGHAELAVQKLHRLLDVPFQVGEHQVRLAVTVGVALCPQHATHPDYLLRLAEKALVAARAAGAQHVMEVGVPPGPCAVYDDVDGNPLGVIEETRPARMEEAFRNPENSAALRPPWPDPPSLTST